MDESGTKRARLRRWLARHGRLAATMAALSTAAACDRAPVAQARAATPALAAAPAQPTPLGARSNATSTTNEAPAAAIPADNHRSLGAAAVPFARYLSAAHERIHPAFADARNEIASHLPAPTAGRGELVTTLEIVLDHETGKLVRLGVIRSSGLTAFDVAALSAVASAQPFGKAPEGIASPDGNVYVQWEFHSEPTDACSLRNAFPLLLKSAPAPAAGSPP